MLNQEFENKLKAHLEQGRSEWDREALWSDIEAGLPKKRRRVAIWFLFPLLLGLTAALYFGYADKSEKNFESVQQQAEVEVRNEINETVSLHNSRQVNENEVLKSEAETSKISKKLILRETKENIIAPDTGNEITRQVSSENLDGALDGKTALDNQAPRFVAEELPVHTSTGNSIFSSETNKETELHSSTSIYVLNQIDRIYSYIKYSYDPVNITGLKIVFPEPIEVAEKTKARSFVSIGAGAALSGRTLQLIEPNASEYMQAREADEKVLESIRMHMGYGRFIGSQFSLTGLLDYEIINEQFDYSKSTTTEFSTWVPDAYSYTSLSGETMYQSGKVMGRETVNSRHKRFNGVHSLNMSVLLGYHLEARPFSVVLRTGPVFNLYRSFKGEVYNQNREVELYNNQNRAISSLFNAWDTQLNLEKSLSPHWGISLGANFRKGIGDFSLNGLVSQKYNQWGLHTTVVYKL